MPRRVGELFLSLTYAAVCTVLVVAGLYAVTGLFSDWSQVAHFGGTLLVASWLILAQAKLMEGTSIDSGTRRVAMALSGLAVAGTSLWLSQMLVVNVPTADSFNAVFDRFGAQRLVEAGTKGQPTFAGYLVFFGGLMALRRWWRQADSFRSKRLAIKSIVPSALLGLALTALFAFPTAWGTIWAAALSSTVQLSASWMSPSERVAMMEGAHHA